MKLILVIDDESRIRTMLKVMLERESFRVITASDGKEGMKLLAKEPVDLVITDLIMPEKEGLEVIQELRKSDSNLPVIAISGGGKNSPDTYLNMARLLGADAIFEKPVKKDKLINAVKKSLNV